MAQRPSSYDSVSKWLHWTTAVLLVAGFFIGEVSLASRTASSGEYNASASILDAADW